MSTPKRTILRRLMPHTQPSAINIGGQIIVEAKAFDITMIAHVSNVLGTQVPPRFMRLLDSYGASGMAGLAAQNATDQEILQVASIACWLESNGHAAPDEGELEITIPANAAPTIVADALRNNPGVLAMGHALLKRQAAA